MGNPDRIAVRRIVTGHDAEGKAMVVSDGEPPNSYELSIKGTYFTEIWNTKETPASLDNGRDPTLGHRRMAPYPHGSAIRIVQIAPEQEGQFTGEAEQLRAHFRELGSPDAATYRANSPHPLMHRTESIDYGIVLEGEVTLILDDSSTILRPGDIVVQRGTNHAWSNRGSVPCRVAFVLIGGKYTDEIKEALARHESSREEKH
jgi:mannose-6-phosphate isomerase-like protein (cupin superfamily)